MKAWLLPSILCLGALGAGASPIEDALRSMGDGRLEFRFEARDGVCGNGRNISICSDCDRWDWDCDGGPVRVLLTVRDGEVRILKRRVGGRRSLGNDSQDLGEVEPQEAADFLMKLCYENDSVADEALEAAVLARDVELWPDLLKLAKDRRRHDDVRETALFWLGQEASAKAAESLIDFVELDEQDLELREHAIFALSQRDEDESLPALMRIAKTHEVLELRKTALFWLSQYDDPRVIELFEELLTSN